MFKNGLRPVHPGEVLKEEFLEPLGISVNALAKAIGKSPARLNEIVRHERGVTPETALLLARALDTTPQFWLNLQNAYSLKIAEADMEDSLKKISSFIPRSA